jgi:hypothetical protein
MTKLSHERKFQNAYEKDQFDTRLFEDCLHTVRESHAHSGCQQAAVLDAVARYRDKTLWIAHFDVDEFMFPRKTHGKSAKTTVQQLKDMEEYDEIIVSIYIDFLFR